MTDTINSEDLVTFQCDKDMARKIILADSITNMILMDKNLVMALLNNMLVSITTAEYMDLLDKGSTLSMEEVRAEMLRMNAFFKKITLDQLIDR
jgi:hypothetical protein